MTRPCLRNARDEFSSVVAEDSTPLSSSSGHCVPLTIATTKCHCLRRLDCNTTRLRRRLRRQNAEIGRQVSPAVVECDSRRAGEMLSVGGSSLSLRPCSLIVALVAESYVCVRSARRCRVNTTGEWQSLVARRTARPPAPLIGA